MRRLRRWYIPAYRGQRGPAGRASPQAGAGARRGRPAARIAAAVYVSPELYSLPVSQQFASLRPPLGGRTRLVLLNYSQLSIDGVTMADHTIMNCSTAMASSSDNVC